MSETDADAVSILVETAGLAKVRGPGLDGGLRDGQILDNDSVRVEGDSVEILTDTDVIRVSVVRGDP